MLQKNQKLWAHFDKCGTNTEDEMASGRFEHTDLCSKKTGISRSFLVVIKGLFYSICKLSLISKLKTQICHSAEFKKAHHFLDWKISTYSKNNFSDVLCIKSHIILFIHAHHCRWNGEPVVRNGYFIFIVPTP